ncbi:MAG TPA: hypothetical protein PLD20_30505 [Blastocatellia bacterium]|nr:hypothetical protein [Blastocatellia bacterium]HMV87114.1 hypothetical protein [Blastocatellia bacterium]HMY74488.1 hypothetical protein [Blastocatellia bacterium]HMZ22303.1 hypothetical protein [Blastocatellia bacterium]HNG31778.1 hypothetical protein [Blastocatellia bacterium]
MNHLLWLFVVILFSIQTPASKIKSDLEEEGLKNKIQMIRTESTSVSIVNGKTVEGERRLFRVDEYDSNGYRTKSKTYGMGNQTIIYGFLDGDRTLKFESVQDGTEPPPPAMPPPPPNAKKPDPRFDIRHKVKFDDKDRVIERLLLHNDGTQGNRILYKYDDKGNRVESSLYTADGKLNSKQNSVFDANGNVAESIAEHSDGSRTYIAYSYEFDSKGNWIKRVEAVKETNDSKTVYIPAYVHYRTIKYY